MYGGGEVTVLARMKHSSSVFKRRGGGEQIAWKGRRREKAPGAATASYVGRANRRAMGVGFSRLPVPPGGNAWDAFIEPPSNRRGK